VIVLQTQLSAEVQKLMGALSKIPQPVAQPFFIVVSGLPGTGKSYFSHRLRERLPCAVVESDALRQVLFPMPSYSAQESQRLFQALHLLIEELLSRSIPVLLDATNLVEHHRERLYRIADRCGAKLIIVRAEAPAELIQERLRGRTQGANPEDNSEAGWAIYQRMKPKVQKIQRHHLVLDTSRDITPVINKVLRELKR
jgi:hypothetical protein